ncbi:MAG: 3-hydroxyacyl-(acyl-carrier-protein) dehydratase FabZ [Syntrophaceae bacterium PtaU1.Bin231]|nr:MAG: 3-hydroxyacyl-(acyl-carrier-protein) dehydratase FabZ [Syntrophaceae bacterium PtaU1.Bin231]HOG15877.1 beta-hydroxyacyl-ACP dehydratase [Syntrophales bacterium]
MGADRQTVAELLAAVPQQRPFRFIDDILEIDENHVVGACRFRPDEAFYAGHFPGNPVTPGVILIETMAQTGVVAFGLYLMKRSGETAAGWLTLFTTADEVEFSGIVRPGERVIVRGEKVYFRRGALKCRVRMERENGEPVCTGTLAGMRVPAGDATFQGPETRTWRG